MADGDTTGDCCAPTIALVQQLGRDGTCPVCEGHYLAVRGEAELPTPDPVPRPRKRPLAVPTARPGRVHHADPADACPPQPLERAAHAARQTVPDDPELVRVRCLLADLRPDCPDPLEPPPAERAQQASPVTIRDPMAGWGDVPRGVDFGGRAEYLPTRTFADVRRELAELPPEARAVLTWLRSNATLAKGLRGLYVDAGVAFATAEQSTAWEGDLGARREGAYAWGRRLVLASAGAWGR